MFNDIPHMPPTTTTHPPLRAPAFSVANEDSNCYSFDMRKLDRALMVHKDHAAAVMDIHYSPTGKEFVSASYDRTVRIWRADAGKSREVYHTKRMQRVFTARFTGDAKYVLSGSDDMNVRVWKADASAPLGRQLPRERARGLPRDAQEAVRALARDPPHRHAALRPQGHHQGGGGAARGRAAIEAPPRQRARAHGRGRRGGGRAARAQEGRRHGAQVTRGGASSAAGAS